METSTVKVSDARKEYRKLKDETSKGALDAAIEEQVRLQQELESTEAEIRLNNKAYNALEKSASCSPRHDKTAPKKGAAAATARS